MAAYSAEISGGQMFFLVYPSVTKRPPFFVLFEDFLYTSIVSFPSGDFSHFRLYRLILALFRHGSVMCI